MYKILLTLFLFISFGLQAKNIHAPVPAESAQIQVMGCEGFKAEARSVFCGPDATVKVWLADGTAPYCGPGLQVSPGYFEIDGLEIGSHTLTFIDKKGCELTVPVEIVACDCEGLKAKVISKRCGAQGTVVVRLTGGTPKYSGPGVKLALGYFSISGLDIGTHTLAFFDSEGCEVEVTFYMPACGCEDLEAEVLSLSCGENSTAVILIKGGTGSHSGPGSEVSTSTFEVTGLDVGEQTLTYWDYRGCKVEVTFVVEECCIDFEAELRYVTCGPEGSIGVLVSGGSKPYTGDGMQVGIDGYFVVDDLEVGTHTLTFEDSERCETQVTFYKPACGCEDLQYEILSKSCAPNSRVVVFLSGGSLPYTGPQNAVQFDSPGKFAVTGLDAGIHTLTFVDGDDCEIEVTFTIFNSDGLNAQVTEVLGCAPDGRAIISVTGGLPPYLGPGLQCGDPNEFTIHGLTTGDHMFTYLDANGCSVDVEVTIPDVFELVSLTTTISNCEGSGSLIIKVSGGVVPYHFGSQLSNSGTFFLDGIPAGTYPFTVYDDNKCKITGSYTIDQILLDGCEQFTFDRDQTDNTGTDIYNETFNSGISATINVSLDGREVPDQLTVYVNNTIVLDFSAGSYDCDGPSAAIESGQFNVSYCDVVKFTVRNNICSQDQTAWFLTVTCTENSGGSRTSSFKHSTLNQNFNSESNRYQEEMRLNSIPVVEVFPNPVSDMLNINIYDRSINYESIRIVAREGNVVHEANISGLEQLQLDVSEFPNGMYIIELTATSGYKNVKKFMKVD